MAMAKNLVAVELMKHLVDHADHGYSQYSREGDGTGTHPVTIDGKTYRVRNGDRDCSSAVIDAYTTAGVDCGGATYTGNMRSCMTGTGNFEWVPMSYSAQPGDVYLNEGAHTAMCISSYGSTEGDILAEFSISELGGIDGAEGDQTGWESHRAVFYDYPWDGILRYTGKADGGTGGEQSENGIDVNEEECGMECIIQPNGLDVLCYFDGQGLHDLDNGDEVKALDAVYRATHGGKPIPCVRLGRKDAPYASRLVQALAAPAPSEKVAPGLNAWAEDHRSGR